MNAVFAILALQAVLGAFDNFWHHELSARLPSRASARWELSLHAMREAIYALVFAGLAWFRWQGAWAALLAALLLAELCITAADFLEEDRTRKLPPLERVLHTVLAVCYGIFLGLFSPVLLTWAQEPTGLVLQGHGWVPWLFTGSGLAVLAWSLRNVLAVRAMREMPAAAAPAPGPGSRAAVLVTGATGFIGSALVQRLLAQGRRVIVLSRDGLQARAAFGPAVWVVERLDDIPSESRIAAIVHLAGAPVLGLPWTAARRRQLLHSRTDTARALLALLRRLEQRPELLLSASAVGFYGLPSNPESLDESAPAEPGRFQSDLCAAVEHEARRAEGLGLRVVRLRLGIVLGRGGGAYPGLALASRLGLGAVLGHGRQPMPWIHREDAIGLICFALDNARMSGAVNAVAPDLQTQAAFGAALAGSFGRRVHVRLPARLLSSVLGEMSELLLAGQLVRPQRALDLGYRFRHPTLATALGSLAVELM